MPEELGQDILVERDKETLDSLEKSLKEARINLVYLRIALSDFIKLLEPICGPDHVHLIKNFLRHKAVHELIRSCSLSYLWKFFQENPGCLDTLDPNFVKKNLMHNSTTYTNGITYYQWAEYHLPYKENLPMLKWLRDNYPEALEETIKNIQCRHLPCPISPPTLDWMKEYYPKETNEVMKSIQPSDIQNRSFLPIIQWIKDNYPNQFDRIVKNISEHRWFQKLFPGYESPIAWSRLIKQCFFLK